MQPTHSEFFASAQDVLLLRARSKCAEGCPSTLNNASPPPPPCLDSGKQGHLEFFICNAADLAAGEDSVVTQECFNKYPLTRAADDGDASPIDPNYPGRYYVDPPCREDETDQTKLPGAEKGPVNTARYQLPEGLVCDRCTIQMIYCEFRSMLSSRVYVVLIQASILDAIADC